jgi:Family of unknown function (DUF5995)
MASSENVSKEDLLLQKLPTTIDEVIAQLDKIISYCSAGNNCACYFAVLYRKVTCKVRDCIINKDFEDAARMERLDVAFANRYLQAFYLWLEGKLTAGSWKVAFDSTSDKSVLVIQHLLLGMNAHINFDLGIATAFVMNGTLLETIHKDFDGINAILDSMTDNIEACLTKINPLMRLLNLNIYKYDEMLVSFSITTARDGAWSFATDLSGKAGSNYDDCIRIRDKSIEQLGNNIAKPRGLLLKLVVKIIRLFEKKDVSKVIRLLGN